MTRDDGDRPQLHSVSGVSDDSVVLGPQGTDPDEVAALLNDIRNVLARYIVLDDFELDAIALWAMHTYVFREFFATPYLSIESPTIRSGKTNLLTVLEAICYEPQVWTYSSLAGLYQSIEQLQPTLLFDEIDMAALSKNYRGILHGGYKRGAYVVIGSNSKPRRLNTYCPKAYAYVGSALSATLLDRSIQIHMRRKLPTETVAPFSLRELAAVTDGLTDRLANFRANFIALAELSGDGPATDTPNMPEVLNDREREVWRALFAIAAQATGWDTRCWNAAIQLTKVSRQEEPDDSVLLLADIKAAFGDREKLFSEELLSAIRNLPDPHYAGPATRTTKALANALAPHRIFPRQMRMGETSKKGYVRQWFADAFARYPLPTETNETTETSETEE